jgi:hypothetical protein
MSGAIRCAVTLTLIAALPALVMGAPSAYAQDNRHILTIADCPKGYSLGVADTDQPQPIGRAADYLPPRTGEETVAAAREAAAAPKAFVTGCIPPQTKNK